MITIEQWKEYRSASFRDILNNFLKNNVLYNGKRKIMAARIANNGALNKMADTLKKIIKQTLMMIFIIAIHHPHSPLFTILTLADA